MGAFENFMVAEMAKRSALEQNSTVGYDDNPNEPTAPPALQGAPAGTWFYEETANIWWRKIGAGATDWEEQSWGVSPTVTQEAFTITVTSGGTDPSPVLRVTSQAEVDTHGDFLTVGGAIGALYGLLLKHVVTIQLPAGTWTLAEGELDQTWRTKPTYTSWPIEFGRILIKGAAGWTVLLGTTEELAVSSDGSGNIVFASDPFGAADAVTHYLYVISGTGAGQFKPIRTHSGVNATIAGVFSPALDGTSLMRIAEPATKLKFDEQVLQLRGNREDLNLIALEFFHLTLETTPATGGWIESENVSIRVDGGVRFADLGFYSTYSYIWLGDVSFDNRNFPYPALDTNHGAIYSTTAGTRYFLGGGNPGPVVRAYTVESGAFTFIGDFAFDGYTSYYLEFRYSAVAVLLPFTATQFRSDEGADYAIKVYGGAHVQLTNSTNDPATRLAASTFKGSISDVWIDGHEVTWAEIAADPGKSMSTEPGSVVWEEGWLI